MTDFFVTSDGMTPEENRAFRQEGLILDVTEQIWAAMDKKEIVQKTLAESLGTSKANVSRLLNGSRNMTLRTLSDIADALNSDVRIRLEDRETGEGWISISNQKYRPPKVSFVAPCPLKTANDWTPMRKANG